MTQQEHLTTEQLSAFLDKQLTPQEQAFFDAHLQSCQRCQHVLAELRGTVALLRAMPEPPLPRSFTLPAGLSQTPVARPQPLPPLPMQQRRVPRYILQRTVRAVSTLAAVIAVLFILSSLLPLLSFHGGGATAGSTVPQTASNSGGTTHNTSQPNPTQAAQTPHATPNMASHQTGTPAKSPVAATPTPAPTTTSSSDQYTRTVVPPSSTPPPFLDISQPAGRLLLGALLLLLGIAGLIATRRVRRSPWQR